MNCDLLLSSFCLWDKTVIMSGFNWETDKLKNVCLKFVVETFFIGLIMHHL